MFTGYSSHRTLIHQIKQVALVRTPWVTWPTLNQSLSAVRSAGLSISSLEYRQRLSRANELQVQEGEVPQKGSTAGNGWGLGRRGKTQQISASCLKGEDSRDDKVNIYTQDLTSVHLNSFCCCDDNVFSGIHWVEQTPLAQSRFVFIPNHWTFCSSELSPFGKVERKDHTHCSKEECTLI